MRIELTLQDLTRVRLAPEADPLAELVSSLQILQRRDAGSALFNRWRHRVRLGLGESASVLLWLCRPYAPIPAFLVPGVDESGLEAGLAEVARTDPLCLKSALRDFPVNRELPSWAAGLPDGDTAGLPKLVQAMQDYFELSLAPGWEPARAQVDADRGMRAQLLLHDGADAMLTSLRPLVRWSSPVLEVGDGIVGSCGTDGGGLIISPTYFAVCPVIVPAAGRAPVRLLYPSVRQAAPSTGYGRDVRRSPDTALADLLGPTRAATLAVLGVGCSTSELAARLGVTPSAASKHAAVLRRAGLITTERDRNAVLHALTPLGTALLGN
ncbi:ArsR family transcriptional regulator [Amycolatopsis sp. MJM2582]|uniref:ArsR/SmtB family transcription factor n=1 Tax=Amycolatopsis sp. MJM2582 TaxID=1427749 RepID=UPI0005008F5D|nr:helix-turn-helix domain-containing protein [Amycolatopsis sp. MJM2582]KFZ81313.1 ArsR family transcriptional regulator [Amycolatopsis sp. MJM2582]